MLAFFFSLLLSAWATPATKISGKFRISGFSFGGRVPGEIYIGNNGEFQLQLLRPSGLSILSVTTTQTETCFLFDFDDTQYRGTNEEFAALSHNNLLADQLSSFFIPTENLEGTNTTWKIKSNKRRHKRITVPLSEEEMLLDVKYHLWRNHQPHRLSIHILENDWKLKATLQNRESVDWTFSCEPPEGITTVSFSEMQKAIVPRKRRSNTK